MRTKRRGYVLLVVLAVLVLMVTVLATLSKLSLRRGLAAADAQLRLQQRWGADSIEAALLPRAAKLFDRLQQQADQQRTETGLAVPFPGPLRDVITIGGVTFDIVIADEDAKLNLNRVYHSGGQQQTLTAINDLVGPTASRAVRLVPAVRPLQQSPPVESDESSEEIPRALRSWGEVFDLVALREIVGDDAALPNVTDQITCWGGGALNIRRASDQAIQTAAATVLSDAGARRLVSRYRDGAPMNAAILIQQEADSETQRSRLRRMLAETSTHFSLWIDASTTGRRSGRTFSVMRLTDDGLVINQRFAF
ncbi:type II secretion system protein GspK [Stieleria sp. TO1_6]|uniref:type II secretion system protein GspK n=1 Tax=Stieleria tagensis TaxID=2956795 RepID=UPI00209B9FCF|nr:type II secretion system protein GspK [Stieleria tagensis]MCO8121763.1 type II secretion system protein GspK [Stieleria tagensis]